MFGFGGTPVFKPDQDIPDLSGKVFLVTGGNVGLGKETVTQLAKHKPSHIWLAARSKAKADEALAEVKKTSPSTDVRFLELDLGSFASVRQAAETFKSSSDRLDVLINNAGVMAMPPGTTTEGYEIQFGTNHMGHALLIKLLLPTLQKTATHPGADVRIVNLSSVGHTWAPSGGLALDRAKTPMTETSTWVRYGQSKLANILYTRELARRYPDIKNVAVHPGSVNTTLSRGPAASYPAAAWLMNMVQPLLTVSVATGALGQLWAAFSPEAKSGTYYVPLAKQNPGSKYAQDTKLAERLWEWTEKELTSKGY